MMFWDTTYISNNKSSQSDSLMSTLRRKGTAALAGFSHVHANASKSDATKRKVLAIAE